MLLYTNMYIYINKYMYIIYMYHLCVKAKHFASHGTSWVFSRPLDRKKTQFLTRHWPLCLFWTSAFLNRFHWFRIKHILIEIPLSSVHDTKKNKYPNFVFTITVFITTKTNHRTPPPTTFQLNFNDCLYRFFTFILQMVDGLLGNGFTFVQNLVGVLNFLQSTYISFQNNTKKTETHVEARK